MTLANQTNQREEIGIASPQFDKLKPGELAGADILSSSQFCPEVIDEIFEQADYMADVVDIDGGNLWLDGKVIANLFYEPSTRTSMSFKAAAKRLGASTVSTQGVEYSSIAKGESLEDTVRTVERYTDLIVLRHEQIGAAALAAEAMEKPVINAGDGVGEHPTQALLDLYTINQNNPLDRDDELTVTMLGDLKNGRTVHSLARLLKMYEAKINLVSPDELAMPNEIKRDLGKLVVAETSELDGVLPESDVLYVTRVQKERFTDPLDYEKVNGSYKITPEVMNKAPGNMSLMHPFPRIGEISDEVDSDPRAVYFDQIENGMYVRMALLSLIFGKNVAAAEED